MNQHVYQQIDKLILENGEYSPLDFLLQEGRLNYADYEDWRQGKIELLSDILFGNLEQIIEQWIQAEAYLQKLGWVAETMIYQPIASDSSQRLIFSLNTKHEYYFHKRFSKSEDQPQADLFMDTQATTVFNHATRAIIENNRIDARQHLEKLFDIAPGHNHLGELELLVEALESLSTDISDPRLELLRLQNDITPTATALLRKDKLKLLIPLWRRLTKFLTNTAFDSKQAEVHASYSAGKSQDWDQVRQSIEKESDWKNYPDLLIRHAQASERLRLVDESLLSWFELCWRFPQHSDAIEDNAGNQIRNHWITFWELEPELPAQEFPSWLLFTKPGILKSILRLDNIIEDKAYNTPLSFSLLHTLEKASNEQYSNKDIIAIRAQLKQNSPDLFCHYISRVGK